MKDYYKILEVSPNASEEVTKAAYKALAKKYHPDSLNFSTEYGNKMQEINEAYTALCDPLNRLKYDKEYKKCFGKNNCQEIYWSTETNQNTANSKKHTFLDKEKIYQDSLHNIRSACTVSDYAELIVTLNKIKGYKDAEILLRNCRKDLLYRRGTEYLRRGTVLDLKKAKSHFEKISQWRDSDSKLKKCNEKLKSKSQFKNFFILFVPTIIAMAIGVYMLLLMT